MKNLLHFITSACLCLWVGFNSTDEIKHSLQIIHKGISLTKPVICTLVEVTNDNALPHEFYMDVESVVCGDNQCKIDVVRIYWDELGRFNKLVLPKDVHLEKAEGISFTDKDYNKLNDILKNEDSPLQDVFKDEIVGTVGGEGVDAMSGETILLEKSAYVKGAVWTCYSLWHWVHGDIKQHIKDITGKSYSKQDLRLLLKQKDYQAFAIEQLTKKEGYSKQTAHVILNAIETDPSLLKSSLPYWENAPKSIYAFGSEELLSMLKPTNRMLFLTSILQTQQELSPDFFNQLTPLVSEFTYQEIDIFLNILKEKQMVTNNIIQSLVPLLKAENFIISRRAYYFLEGIDLSKENERKTSNFFEKWKDRL